MKKYFKQLGQGMTEYIIIVALIAIAAIAVYSFFGDTVRGQMGAMTMELGGQDGSTLQSNAVSQAKKAGSTDAAKKKTLSNFSDSQKQTAK